MAKVTHLVTAVAPPNSERKESPVESSGQLPEPNTPLPDKLTTTAGTTKGKWVSGVSGNPRGRPKDVRTVAMVKNTLELAVREKLTAADVTRIVNRLVEIALTDPEPKNAIPAAKLIMDMAISKAAVQDMQDQKSAITIIIENATLAAKQIEKQPIVEAQYVEVNGQ
jgi:hypothetical protein